MTLSGTDLLEKIRPRAEALVDALPIKACYVGEDAAIRLAEWGAQHGGRRVFLLADEHTRAAAGSVIDCGLKEAHLNVVEHILPGNGLDATEEAAEAVAQASGDADWILGIGSGTVSDLAKYAGHLRETPVLLFPTAASMNGYTSGIAALKVRGLKRTISCAPALGVFADPRVVASAPQRMTAAGVADFLSKCSASADWRTAHELRDEFYSAQARVFFHGTQERLLDACPAIGRAEPEAVGVALEALLLSGFSMVVAGSSSPASGGEHLISHFLDMKSAINHTPHDLHGTQVGVATVHCLGLWERIVALDPKLLDPAALAAAQSDEAAIRASIDEDWGDVADEVWKQWSEKARDCAAVEVEIRNFQESFEILRQEVAQDLLPMATVAEAITAAGGPTRPEDITVPLEDYVRALQCARFLRNRFTVLDLAAELCLR